jgi:DNA-binding transcriptional regulator YiaG
MIAKETARKVAQILFPQLWQTSPVEAIAMAIEYLHEAAGGLDSNSQHGAGEANVGPVSTVVKALAEHIQKHKMHVNVVSRSLGVSTYTVRTWLEGKYKPNEENSAKITRFLQSLQSTPEIFTPEP